ncbi:hypothetical protein K505DRAFT_1783 [Melanomma pulvis-pyrius CBS 109.77]|uniref:Uncharacterized protein n=1 Tax=Melanomma pulvis-pyrius CBS 109.77 TaxID=1314802 RepID=A0A6A6XVS8_9PLEO|nr:hypothetical protein K505DRAFT_1783 [Melanomma pulvis-pyrius CBS 109.77]
MKSRARFTCLLLAATDRTPAATRSKIHVSNRHLRVKLGQLQSRRSPPPPRANISEAPRCLAVKSVFLAMFSGLVQGCLLPERALICLLMIRAHNDQRPTSNDQRPPPPPPPSLCQEAPGTTWRGICMHVKRRRSRRQSRLAKCASSWHQYIVESIQSRLAACRWRALGRGGPPPFLCTGSVHRLCAEILCTGTRSFTAGWRAKKPLVERTSIRTCQVLSMLMYS